MASSSRQGLLRVPWGPKFSKISKFSKKIKKKFFIFFFELSHSESKKTKKKYFFFYHRVGHSRLRIFSEFSKILNFSNFSVFLDIWHGVSLDQYKQRYNGHFWLKRSFWSFWVIFWRGNWEDLKIKGIRNGKMIFLSNFDCIIVLFQDHLNEKVLIVPLSCFKTTWSKTFSLFHCLVSRPLEVKRFHYFIVLFQDHFTLHV